jgi:putative DNA primase/helicase
MKTKDLALQLSQDLQLKIFPCYPRGHERAKAPMTEHGQKDAANVEGVILRWFGGPTPKLIGLPCKDNGIFAVDVDTPEAAGTWSDWIKEFGMSEPCPSQKTTKGAHYVFKFPDFDFTGAVGKLAPGMDLRADNYICTGGEGSGYEWMIPLATGVPEAPTWLLDKIRAVASKTTAERTAPTTEPLLNPGFAANYWLRHYAQKATIGTRNESTYKMGLQLYYAGISLHDALDLWPQWQRSIPQARGNEFTQYEYNRTIKSAYSGIQREAATLPAEAVIEQKAPAKTEPKPAATSAPEAKKAPKSEGKAETVIKPPETPKVEEIKVTFSTWSDLDGILGPLEWEWENWLAKGFLHILVGQTGEGKSRLALRVAATYLTDLGWPDGASYEGARGSVGWAEAEAGQAMNRDRARAMGLPTDNILSPLSNPLDDFRMSVPGHQAKLAALAMRPDIKIIVVDSLSGADPTAEKSTEDAKSINWLAALARDCQKPILLTHHLRKRGMLDTEGEVDLDRVRGISTILQYARVIWAIDTPDLTNKETKRLSVIKSNLAKKPKPIGFTINDTIEFTDAPEKPRNETRVGQAADLLLALLEKEPKSAAEILDEFEQAGFSKSGLYRAKDALGVVSIRKEGRWVWSLPHRDS